MAAIDWYQMLLNSQIELDDYCKFAGIEIGSSEYLEIAQILEDRKLLEIVPKQNTFGDLSNAINNAPRNEAANSIIDSLNDNIKSNGASSIIGGINDSTEGNVNRIYSKSGDIIEFYVDSAEKTNNPSGAYKDGLTISEPINAVIDDAGDVVLERGAGRNNLGKLVDGFLGTVSTVFAAVGVINFVGKLVSKPLYETSVKLGYDMYQLDPDYCDNIFAGDTRAVAMLQNVIWNLNPENNDLTMYIDDRFAAAVVGYLMRKGWFNINDVSYSQPTELPAVPIQGLNYPVAAVTNVYSESYDKTEDGKSVVYAREISNIASGKIVMVYEDGNNFQTIHPYYVSKIDDRDSVTFEVVKYVDDERTPAYHETVPAIQTTSRFEFNVFNKKIYAGRINTFWTTDNPLGKGYLDVVAFINPDGSSESTQFKYLLQNAGYLVLYGTGSDTKTITGVTNQPNARVFSIPGTDATYNEITRQLAFDYPEIWRRALKRGVLDDEGSIKTRTYIPIPAPWGSPATSPEIETGNSKQTYLSPSTDLLPDVLADSLPNTASKPNNETKNPPKDDTGISPPILPPSGKASSMWAVYNPSQSELDSFGSWLWSSNLVDQIAKIFNDPMQAIIGVHKVFCSPPVSGRKNIKVGYLDSKVNSNAVGGQYVEVDCGTVTLGEYFGNVLDYSPYTTVHIYLPFVGVVPLDTADVMRSTIGVTYGIDVLTGDCLAKVSVYRGDSGGILYSFPGNCAVKYPTSSGSYMSILGYAVGAAASIYTGNIGVMGAVSGVFGNRPTVQHGGSFVGNSGATGPKTPYLIISRPQSAVAIDFNSYEGYPVNTTQKIGDCKGFIRVKDVHLTGINATDDELDMIDQILKDGIIVQS